MLWRADVNTLQKHDCHIKMSLSMINKSNTRATRRFSLPEMNSKIGNTWLLVPFCVWAFFGDESLWETELRAVWQRLLPFSEKKQKKTYTYASVQWRGSQTPKDAPPVPSCKHTNWLPGCLEAAQLSAEGKKYSWRFACIHYLPCGKTARVLLGKLFPQF